MPNLNTPKKKWVCKSCDRSFNTKKELVEDLINHYEWASQEADEAEEQLDNLSKNWRNY